MTVPNSAARKSKLQILILLFLVTLAAVDAKLFGQNAPLQSARDAAIESHFAAAQRAQRDQDFTKAEKEYQAVISLAPGFAEVHMNLGLVYQIEARFNDATEEFERALKLKPGLSGANFFLGVDYCKAGDGKKAIPYLRMAVRVEPNRPDTWLWLAQAQEISGQIYAEVETVHQALELHPKDADLLYILGNAYERLGKQEVARLGKLAPGSPRSEQLLGESYAASSEWPSAVIHFQNALAAAPNRVGLRVELGEVLLRAGKVKQATREFDEEVRRDPDNLRALVRRGEARLIAEDVEDALQDWEKAVAIDLDQTERILGIRETGFGDAALEQLPEATRETILKLGPDLHSRNSPAAHLASSFLAAQNGDIAQAEAEASLAASSVHRSETNKSCTLPGVNGALQRGRVADVSLCLGKVLTAQTPVEFRMRVAGALLESGDSQRALTILKNLPAAGGNSAEASYWRARCYEKLATEAYLRLYQADSDSYRLHQLMGDLEAAKGDDGKAIEEYRGAIALKSSSPNLHYSLGHLLWKDLKVPEARAELNAELELNPHHPGALNDLGDTYLLEHQPDKALPYLVKALAADPENSDIHRDLGTAYSELHDYRKAEEQYKIAVTADHDGSVHYKLARVYQALGQKEDAAREFALSTTLNRESHSKLEKQTERVGEVTRSAENP